MTNLLDGTRGLLDHLSLKEEPFGFHYADQRPQGFGPRKGEVFSREREDAGKINWLSAAAGFCCVVKNILLARRKGSSAWISHQECGCLGAGYYLGLYQPYLESNLHIVSTGMSWPPVEGEHYMPSVECMRRFMEDALPPPATGKYGIFKPLSAFTVSAPPEVVIFFVRAEALVGLHALACFATGDHQCVITHFGACCTQLAGWPRVYLARGSEKAVIGGLDISARKYLQPDELSFSMPFSLYGKMLASMSTSALARKSWKGLRKRLRATM